MSLARCPGRNSSDRRLPCGAGARFDRPTSTIHLDVTGRSRSPATIPGYHVGRIPPNKREQAPVGSGPAAAPLRRPDRRAGAIPPTRRGSRRSSP
jgi:hypothetical protein